MIRLIELASPVTFATETLNEVYNYRLELEYVHTEDYLTLGIL